MINNIKSSKYTDAVAVEVTIPNEDMARIVTEAAEKHVGRDFDTTDAVVKIDHDKWSGVTVTFFKRGDDLSDFKCGDDLSDFKTYAKHVLKANLWYSRAFTDGGIKLALNSLRDSGSVLFVCSNEDDRRITFQRLMRGGYGVIGNRGDHSIRHNDRPFGLIKVLAPADLKPYERFKGLPAGMEVIIND